MARDMLAVLALIALIGVIVHVRDAKASRDEQAGIVAQDLRRLQLEIKLRAATGRGELNEHGWPATISPEWFKGRPPRNTLVASSRAWVEIAGEEERLLEHPISRMTVSADTAGFWYNPTNGIVRARVPVMLSDEHAVALYNRVNGSDFGSIFESEPAPKRVRVELGDESEKFFDDADAPDQGAPSRPGDAPGEYDEEFFDPTHAPSEPASKDTGSVS